MPYLQFPGAITDYGHLRPGSSGQPALGVPFLRALMTDARPFRPPPGANFVDVVLAEPKCLVHLRFLFSVCVLSALVCVWCGVCVFVFVCVCVCVRVLACVCFRVSLSLLFL